MSNFGMALGGFGNAYPQYVQQQQAKQLNDINIKQALQQMQQQQANRQQGGAAIQSLAGLQGQGPGGTITPQQLAAIAQSNPDIMKQLTDFTRPTNTGMFNIQGREVSGQNALDRTQLAGENAQQRVETQQAGANQRSQKANEVRQAIVNSQQEGANKRNANSVSARKSNPASPQNISASPEYKTAKSEYEEAKKDERNIEAHYPLVSQAYNDPQWLDARKRSVAAQKKMEGIQSVKTKQAAIEEQAAPKAEPQPLPPGAEKIPDGYEIPDETGKLWVKKGNQLIPKE